MMQLYITLNDYNYILNSKIKCKLLRHTLRLLSYLVVGLLAACAYMAGSLKDRAVV